MKNSEHITITVTSQEFISGSQEYSVNLNITNISGKPISNLQVFNTLSVGREVPNNESVDTVNLTELEDKKRRLIRELERGVESAYGRKRRKKLSFTESIAFSLVEVADIYASIFSKRRSPTTTPYWAEEALTIDEWEDVERLEKDVISFEDEDSFLAKAYAINKDKLKRVMDKLEKEQNKGFSRGVSLPEGSTISFPFSFKAPHLFKFKNMDLTFKATYKIDAEDLIHTRSQSTRIAIHPSAFAVPTGGMLGAAVGYFIKNTLITSEPFVMNWGVFGGSIALGLVISLLVSRKPDAVKAITVEDLTGGLIIGVLAGLYSETILTKLQALL